MPGAHDILCIGSVLWDVIGRSDSVMRVGSDVPGRITRHPGGVAMIVAMTLRRFGLTPALLTAVGRDEEGEELLRAADQLGLVTDLIYRSDALATDRYMAVEGANGLIAAIAHAHSLEAAGAKILRPLFDGRVGSSAAPYSGAIALDGNLTGDLLAEIAVAPEFAHADLRVAPASPGKAMRLAPFLSSGIGTLYVNLEEASLLAQTRFERADVAAAELVARGARRVLVTDGGRMVAEAGPDGVIAAIPPETLVRRVTGAGDTFMAAHIAAEMQGASPNAALESALSAAAAFVSGNAPT